MDKSYILKKHLSILGEESICPVAIIIKENKFLMGLRHSKFKNNISLWTVPGGRWDSGETIEKTLRRETQEEIGIKDLNILEYIDEVPGLKKGDRVPLFLCSINEEPILMEPEKFSEWKWFGINELPDNFINAEALIFIKKLLAN